MRQRAVQPAEAKPFQHGFKRFGPQLFLFSWVALHAEGVPHYASLANSMIVRPPRPCRTRTITPMTGVYGVLHRL